MLVVPLTHLSTAGDRASPWLRRGHGTACRDLSHRYLHWRPLDVS